MAAPTEVSRSSEPAGREKDCALLSMLRDVLERSRKEVRDHPRTERYALAALTSVNANPLKQFDSTPSDRTDHWAA